MRVSTFGLMAAAAAGAFAIGACATEPSSARGAETTVAPAGSTKPSRQPTPRQDRVSAFLGYRPDAPADRRGQLRALGAHRVHDIDERRMLAVVLPREAVSGLAGLPWLESIEVDSSPPARVSGLAAGDLLTWGLEAIGAPTVHATLGNEGAGARVAVLDARVRCDHADFAGRIYGGYDFVEQTSQVCPPVWDALRYSIHGTAVAGIIAGARNGVGVLGVAPRASLYIARVCGDDGLCDDADVYAALSRMVKVGAQVVNLSLNTICGKSTSHATRLLLGELHELGVIVVNAAGNGVDDGCAPGTPVGGYAAGEGVIAVTHWLPDGTQQPGYQYGSLVDIAAPSRVETAHPSTAVNHSKHDGTSFAAPHVSGALALLLAEGFAGPDKLARRLFETATDRGASGWDDHWGWGTLNAAKAVVRRPVVTSLTGPDTPINREGNYLVIATVAHGAAPIAIRWSVAYSSTSIARSYNVTGGLSHNLDVPEGDYSISVTATPIETIYGRTGSPRSLGLTVCTSGDGGGNPYVLNRNGNGKGDGIKPSRVEGC